MNVVETIAELEKNGYGEAEEECPRCGEYLMLRQTYVLQDDGTETLWQEFHCPHCGWKQSDYAD